MDIFAGFTVLQLAAALTTGLVAAFIRGLAGFGLAIILVPVLALALTPVEAVLTTNVVALLIGGLELPRLLREAEARGERRVAVVAQVNPQLPFMGHDAEVPADTFDHLIDHPRYHHALFPTPKMAVGNADHAIGLYASTLLKDGGTLQIGIGQLGDAIVHSAITRHRDNALYREAVSAFGIDARARRNVLAMIGGLADAGGREHARRHVDTAFRSRRRPHHNRRDRYQEAVAR